MDNMSAITLSKNPVLHNCSKHIDMKFHHIRECADCGAVRLEFVSTKEQLADILTKALRSTKFLKLHDSIGVIKLSKQLQN